MKIYYLSASKIPSREANSIHVMKMCQAFMAKGHELTLFARIMENAAEPFSYYGIAKPFALHRLSYPQVRGIGALVYAKNIRKMVKKMPLPDLFFGRHSYSLLAISNLNIPLIYEAHSPPKSFMEKMVEKKLLSLPNFQKLVVISQALADIYQNTFPWLPKEKIIVAHDGADLPENSASDSPDLGGRKEALQVGYIGHLYPGRGIDIITQLAQEMSAIDFHIVGGSETDITFWKNKCHFPNLFFHGFVKPGQISNYFNSFDILLAPYQNKVAVGGPSGDTSRWMSPMKIFEYMAHRKAIICSDLPVLREVMKDGKNCLLAKPTDLQEWKSAILKLTDKSFRDKLSQQAYQDLSQQYTWQTRVEKLLYSNLQST